MSGLLNSLASETDGLVIDNVCAFYGTKKIVHDVTMRPLYPGEMIVVLGPNGAGKSTLLRAVAGLGKMTGSIHHQGEDLTAMSRMKRSRLISYMPQSQPPAIALTALEAVISACENSYGRKEALGMAFSILERLGIEYIAMSTLAELSGGQRQMVALAQAMVREPKILLLDEPTSALDLRHQVHVMSCARDLARERGAIVIAVLHDISLALRYADRIAILKQGHLEGFGVTEKVLSETTLAQVYGIKARLERCSQGRIQIIVDGIV